MTDPVSTSPAARFSLGAAATAAYDAAVQLARSEEWATRLFDRDATLWSLDPRVGAAIAERLGWLDAPAGFTDRVAALEGFGDAIAVDAAPQKNRHILVRCARAPTKLT